jgi:hypothetical protein
VSGALLDFTLPAVGTGAVLMIVVVRDAAVDCADLTWTKAVDGLGDAGVFLDAWVREVDGTAGSNVGDVISFASLTEQELQGSLITLRYAEIADLIYDAQHEAFTASTSPAPPSVDADDEDDIALCIWSCAGEVEIVAPAGFRTIDVYGSSERSIAVATRRAREVGTLTLEPAALDPAGTGRMFTLAIHYDPPPGGHSHWGPQFSDAAARTVSVPAVAATLDLSTVTSGALVFATMRARTAGGAGNFVQVSIEADAADVSEVRVEESGNDVEIHVEDNATTVAELTALINTDSALIEFLPGASNPADFVQFSDDEFSLTQLTGGVDAQVGRVSVFWGKQFPLDPVEDPPLVTPPTPNPVANFAARIEGLRLTLAWATGLFKSEDGKEQRENLLDDPQLTFEGEAMLFGAEALALRVQLAQHAASGATFGLGLPYEMTTLDADADGESIPVTTAALDWAVPGQRVLILRGADDDIDEATGVIQDVAADSILLDVDPGDAGVRGAVIMPIAQVLLDPQQGFARHRTEDGADRWHFKAYAERFGFPAAAVPGELTVTLASYEVTFRARTPGVSVTLTLEFGAVEPTASISADELGNYTLAIDMPTDSTLGELNAYMNELGLIWMLGDFDPDAAMIFADQFTSQAFVGASAGGPGDMGLGATVTEFADRPLWDRRLENPSTLTESIQSMAEIVEVGIGVPTATASSEIPDWGRQIKLSGELGAEWQWLKAFLGTVRGQWKAFYLPTWRKDLTVIGNAGATSLTINAAIGAYDLWASRGYSCLQVRQGDDVRYVEVTAAVNNGDGTITLTVDGDTLDAEPVDMCSWCELVHLDSDEVVVEFRDARFETSMRARVVQQ